MGCHEGLRPRRSVDELCASMRGESVLDWTGVSAGGTGALDELRVDLLMSGCVAQGLFSSWCHQYVLPGNRLSLWNRSGTAGLTPGGFLFRRRSFWVLGLGLLRRFVVVLVVVL